MKDPLLALLELGAQMLLHTNRMPAGPADEQYPAATVGVTLGVSSDQRQVKC